MGRSDHGHSHDPANDHAHDETAHAGHSAHETEPFPRMETAELVAEELSGERRRQRAQTVLIALGIAAIALGLPWRFEYEHHKPAIEATARGEWSALELGSSLLAQALRAVLRVTPMQAWFLLSALALAATSALWMFMGRRRGYSTATTILATLVLVGAPVVWRAGTTPGAAACGLFGATWLFAALDVSRANAGRAAIAALRGEDASAGARTFERRATIAWLCAALLHPWNVWLWPAYAWSLARHRRSSPWLAVFALAAWAALVVGATALEHGTSRVPEFLATAWRTLLAGGSSGPGPVLVWALAWMLLLAGATAGLLFVAKRAFGPPEARPPVWMLVFALAPLVALGLGGVITFGVPYLWLAPIAFVGTLEIAQRSPRFAAIALAVDVAVVLIASLPPISGP